MNRVNSIASFRGDPSAGNPMHHRDAIRSMALFLHHHQHT